MSRIISKNYKVFKYSELSDSAKAVVHQWYIEGQEPDFFKENVLETLLYDFGLTDLNVYFSLNYCQGDGLCLYGKIYFDDIRKNEKLKQIAFSDFTDKDFENLNLIEQDTSGIDFEHKNSHYSHKYTVDINIDYYDDDNEIDKTAEKLLKNIKEWYYEQCDRFEKIGYDYFYEISDEDLNEHCEANGYEFLENGKHFY